MDQLKDQIWKFHGTEASRRMLLATLVLAWTSWGSLIALNAQEIDITGRVRFSSTESTTVYALSYGVGTQYTDTTDSDFEEFIPPFAPPGGYLIAFDRECSISDGDPPCYFRQDFRGVPDSVTGGENNRFSISYRIRIRNATGKGFTLSILNNDWPRGLDSLRIVDATLAAAFNRIFTGPEVTTIDDPETTWLDVTAYYNLNTLSVATDIVQSKALLSTIANPVTGSQIQIPEGAADLGGNLLLVAVDGRVIRSVEVQESLTDAIDVSSLPSGYYYLLYHDKNDILRERRPLLISR